MFDQKNQERVQYNQSCNRRPIDQLRRAVGGAGIAGQRARIGEKKRELKKASRCCKNLGWLTNNRILFARLRYEFADYLLMESLFIAPPLSIFTLMTWIEFLSEYTCALSCT